MKTTVAFLVWAALRVYVFLTRKPSCVFRTPEGKPYLRRWPLWTRHPWPFGPEGKTGGEGWYLHEITLSDYERTLHNHPASSVAIPLRVGYIEERYEYDERHGVIDRLAAIRVHYRAPLSVNIITPRSFHRLDLFDTPHRPAVPRACWSLFYIAPPHGRGWGFLQADGTVRRAATNNGHTGEITDRDETVQP